jgi:chorismate synthase
VTWRATGRSATRATTTFFVAGFVAEEMLVEVELDAELAG